jgi:hypothetical protein
MTAKTTTARQDANRAKKVLDAAGFRKAESRKNAKLGFAYSGAGYTVSVIDGRFVTVEVSATGTSWTYDEASVQRNRDEIERAKAVLADAGFSVRESARGSELHIR